MISKRELLKGLLLAPLALPLSVAEAGWPNRGLLVQRSQINGMAYYQAEAVLERMALHDFVRLIREPDNRYDNRAVAVYWQQHKLGFIPRVSNYAVARMLDQRQKLEARVALIEPGLMPYQGIEIEIEWVG